VVINRDLLDPTIIGVAKFQTQKCKQNGQELIKVATAFQVVKFLMLTDALDKHNYDNGLGIQVIIIKCCISQIGAFWHL